ncbi:dihydrofolate reductase family protein [Sphingosinicella sp.]|uniref:dihydrofolate reductase family protein n=1 Tax=Sphingosinicella sp. TaxID=1917971 RepID=UPI0040378302
MPVIVDLSMSLDGYVNGPRVTPDEPMGRGGDRLHDWAFAPDNKDDCELLARSIAAAGAFIAGRRTYDHSITWWQADGPTGVARLPLFVVTHAPPAEVSENGVYTFVTDGIEAALRAAKAVAGYRNVVIMGGPDIAQQYLRAGLVDRISIHLAPVLLGGGARLFDAADADRISLEMMQVMATSCAIHVLYRVPREEALQAGG